MYPPLLAAYEEILSFVHRNHYFPSTRELAQATRMSKTMANLYIRALENKGLIKRNPRKQIISIATDAKSNTDWSIKSSIN